MELIHGTANSTDTTGLTAQTVEPIMLSAYKNGQYGYKSAKNNVSQDKLIHDAYFSCGGFRDGSYLVPFPMEKDNYLYRKEISVYANIFKKAMRAIFIPASNGNEKRTSENDFINLFLEDIDKGGLRSIGAFMREVLRCYTIHGYSMAYIASPVAESMTISTNDAKAAKAYPYCRVINPLSIVDGSDIADEFGALLSVTLHDGDYVIEDKKYPKFFRIDGEVYTSYYVKDKIETVLTETIHGLGEIPVVCIRDGLNEIDGLWRPTRTKHDLALMAYDIYNISSEIRDICRRAGFPLMAIEGPMENIIGVPVGGVLNYARDTKVPQYISIDTSIINDQHKLKEAAINELLSIAEQAGVQRVAREAKSGFAMSIEFRGLNEEICEKAKRAEFFERRMVSLFCKMMNIENDFVTVYAESYFVGEDLPMTDLVAILEAIGVAKINKDEVNRMIARKLFGSEYDDIADDLDAELDSMVEETEPVIHA